MLVFQYRWNCSNAEVKGGQLPAMSHATRVTKPASTQIRRCTDVIGLGTRALFLFPLENSFE